MDFLQTIAHEVGNVLFDYGHPDSYGSLLGAAPLPGTNNALRLMRRGATSAINGGHVIVKQEWDAAEAWFQREESFGTQF